ncbi:MAG: hypothetical protein R3C28_13150 [Pirellulaceae bacterium]
MQTNRFLVGIDSLAMMEILAVLNRNLASDCRHQAYYKRVR